MIDAPRPLNYTAVKTVARDETIRFSLSPLSRVALENRPTAEGGTGGSYPPQLKGARTVHTSMSLTESRTQTDTPTETTHRIDLRELGDDGPLTVGHSPVPHCAVTIRGDVESTGEVRVELCETTWVVDVALHTGELEGVYDDAGPATKPAVVPDWLEAVCECVGVDEVAL